jgi:hypothetical protein
MEGCEFSELYVQCRLILVRKGLRHGYDLSRTFRFIVHYHSIIGARGGSVVEALRYKPEVRGIDSRWCHWNFSLT